MTDELYDSLLDILHNEGKIFQVIPDQGDDEEWVVEMRVEDLMMLVERAIK